jgi:hypothetical protein
LPSTLTILNASKSKITSLPTIPQSLINIDVSNCLITQRNADIIIINLLDNNKYSGTIYIAEQYRFESDTTTRSLNTTGTNWLKLKNPPYNWDVF